MAIHTYHINLDERGEFRADVRKRGRTVYEITELDVIEDGYMTHKNDTEGLQEHLFGLGVFGVKDSIGTEAEADAEANSNVLRADTDGQMLLPDGTPLYHQYPAGDYDDIKAHEPNLNHLRKALYDSRECGEVPDVSVFILPNGDTIDIDTPETETKKRVYEVKVIRTVTTYLYHEVAADSPEEAKRLAAHYAARNAEAEQWVFSNVEFDTELDDE